MVYSYFGKEQKVYYEKLQNGLEVFVLPNRNINRFHVELVTKFGSEIEKVKLDNGKYLTIPSGTAHFLEHKMFDMEEIDGLSYLAKLGIYSNAGTNYYSTRYYLDGNKNFKEGLEYLLKMIYTPYINDDTVNKEMGIIEEEIKMYDDEPMWIMDSYFRENFYQNILKKNIAGTVTSIHEITSDILNKIYDIFYQPSNMFLVVSGNVSYKKIMDILNNSKELNARITNKEIIYEKKYEKREVLNEYYELKLNIITTKFRYGFKFDLNDFTYSNKTVLRYYLNLVFMALFGEGSTFDEIVPEKRLASSFYVDHFRKDNIYTLDFDGESEYADLFKDEVDKTLKNIDISMEDFERVKKIWYSVIIKGLDNIEVVANSIVSDIMINGKYQDEKKIIDSLKYDELKSIIKELNFNNKTFMLVLPKE